MAIRAIKKACGAFTPTRGIGRIAALALATCIALPPALATETTIDTIQVMLDQAKLLRLPKGTETIIVGNPAVADVSVQKNGVLVITGRMAGRTNFIALDSAGTIISESAISVTTGVQGRLVVQRGLDQNSYDCAPLCLPTVSLGDEDKHFARGVDQTTRRDGLAGQSNNAAPARKQ